MSHPPYPYPYPPGTPGYGPHYDAPHPASPYHALLSQLPALGGRGFWVGAAIGAAAVMLLQSRPAAPARDDGTASQG
ncbi:conserved protein of unknown function [Rhodovastum atsumiense]|uniref:Uncharacterized protein n=1 Tax=Rhodovastum atsumiense TaxID=504468 RepID=A0A5M6IZL4_9PROT|nr:hypothetical protein [Rhodovastum atsumiense]KAA5613782.1 hypothetical protein F1189_03125 [Rhodovastum atsumiense]CAH2601871.1 conserved protein of unknown function [Rhodovastum atsumiense]